MKIACESKTNDVFLNNYIISNTMDEYNFSFIKNAYRMRLILISLSLNIKL